MRGVLAVGAAAAILLAGCGGGTPDRTAAPTAARLAPAPRGLHVSGHRLLDRRGRVVRFHGVNRSGTEYACVQGWGIFDGPSSDASVRAIASWGVNAVRIPLNEQCWLGINGVKKRYGGARYRKAIVGYVRKLHRHGLYAELSLMWAAPGHHDATYQPSAPNADHSPALWRSLARTFRRTPDVILAPWGETTVNAGCFLHGGGAACGATVGRDNRPYRVAGMQQAVDVMRAAGYRGPIAIPGTDYANNLSHWLSHRPRDPRHALIAEAHVYGGNSCADTACLDRWMGRVSRKVPLILGETGETYDATSCGHRNTERFLDWADAHASGSMTWAWDTWGNCSALIASYGGKPRASFGRFVHTRYRATRAQARRIP